MVLRLALPSDQLPLFYGTVMDEKKDGSNEVGKKMWTSAMLFGDQKLVHIEHEGATYRLMITRQGKLILTK